MTFPHLILQESAQQLCEAALELQALETSASLTLLQPHCVGTAQFNPKSRNQISRVRGSRKSQELKHRLVDWECLLCKRESTNLKRPTLSCSCHSFHSFRAASLELHILKTPLDLGSPLFLCQIQSTFTRHCCWDTSPRSCTKNATPHFLFRVKED